MASMWTEFLLWLQRPEVGLLGVALSAFIASTLLPLASGVVLMAYVSVHPQDSLLAWFVATFFNTLGGMSTYALGRYGSRWLREAPDAKWQARLEQYGPPLTALGWLPVVGDGIVLIAGLLKLNVLACLLWQILGRALRYAALLGLLKFALGWVE